MKAKIFRVIAVLLLMLSFYNFNRGYDKRDNYVNSEYSTSLNVNAYVKGDAYNFIVNSNFFTAYSVLGVGYGIGGILFLLGAELISELEKNRIENAEILTKELEKITEYIPQDNLEDDLLKF